MVHHDQIILHFSLVKSMYEKKKKKKKKKKKEKKKKKKKEEKENTVYCNLTGLFYQRFIGK